MSTPYPYSTPLHLRLCTPLHRFTLHLDSLSILYTFAFAFARLYTFSRYTSTPYPYSLRLDSLSILSTPRLLIHTLHLYASPRYTYKMRPIVATVSALGAVVGSAVLVKKFLPETPAGLLLACIPLAGFISMSTRPGTLFLGSVVGGPLLALGYHYLEKKRV